MNKKEWYEIQKQEMKQIKSKEMIKIKSSISEMDDIQILKVMDEIESLNNIISLIEMAIVLYTKYPAEH
tara:strand:+ start:294 stop:500 length:207 start_codon:yes stop_codon:yes gene_type:complete